MALHVAPPGVWKRQRCVASSPAGRRAAPGPRPAWSGDEASLARCGRKVPDTGVMRKRERISAMRNYITSTRVSTVRLQYARLSVCGNDCRNTAV